MVIMVLWQHVFYVADVSGYVMTGPPLVYQSLKDSDRQGEDRS